MFKEHEKFWAFLALGFAVLILPILTIAFPVAEQNQGTQRTIDAALAALTLALGAATNALFRIKEANETQVEVTNKSDNPVPTTDGPAHSDGELPEDQRL